MPELEEPSLVTVEGSVSEISSILVDSIDNQLTIWQYTTDLGMFYAFQNRSLGRTVTQAPWPLAHRQ